MGFLQFRHLKRLKIRKELNFAPKSTGFLHEGHLTFVRNRPKVKLTTTIPNMNTGFS